MQSRKAAASKLTGWFCVGFRTPWAQIFSHVELNMLKPPDIVDVQRSERGMTETISDMQSKVRSSMWVPCNVSLTLPYIYKPTSMRKASRKMRTPNTIPCTASWRRRSSAMSSPLHRTVTWLACDMHAFTHTYILYIYIHIDSWIGLDWIGLDWIGLDWIGLDWIGLDWIGLDWIGLDWIGLDWIGLDWIGLDWIGLDWIGLDWIGLDWIGLDWIGLDWIGLDWIGLDWIGLDWIGLDWIGLDWIGLDWIGLDWIGLDCMISDQLRLDWKKNM